ncbi:MAG: hypothetical protein WBQ59_06485 [Candidatus Acidiferrum sp.]
MNCQQCQKKMRDSLATGESGLAPEVAAHENSCEACGQFHAAQLHLFRSIEIGLRSIVNAPVPASLLPGVRARMDEQPARHGLWTPTLGLLTTVAAAILLFGINHSSHRAANPSSVAGNSLTTSRSNSDPEPLAQPAEKSAEILPRRRASHARVATPSTAAPEVIVLAEEREAFARFVAEVPENREVALALTHPAEKLADSPAEIALLQIDVLVVDPLTPGARE